MSKIGKYLLIFAAVGAVVSAIAGGLLISQRMTDRTTLNQVTAAKAQSDAEAARQKSLAEAAAKAKADSDAKLSDETAQVATLNSQLTDAKKSSDDAKAALQTATDNATTAQNALAAIQKSLNGQTADELVAAKAKAQTDLDTAESEKKILEDSVQGLGKRVADLQDAINRKEGGGKMPGVSGRVTFVNNTWNFVVLNVGLSNGVVPNGELIVYRNNSFLGKVRVTSVEANTAVADILPDSKGDIQIGDYVLN